MTQFTQVKVDMHLIIFVSFLVIDKFKLLVIDCMTLLFSTTDRSKL